MAIMCLFWLKELSLEKSSKHTCIAKFIMKSELIALEKAGIEEK
jgi:hypothetical protein